MRECVQGLESSIRRKRVGESGFNEVDMVSKKRSIKVIGKYLRNFCRTTTLDENFDLVNMINLLKCAEEISLAVFKSILSFISDKGKNKALRLVCCLKIMATQEWGS